MTSVVVSAGSACAHRYERISTGEDKLDTEKTQCSMRHLKIQKLQGHNITIDAHARQKLHPHKGC